MKQFSRSPLPYMAITGMLLIVAVGFMGMIGAIIDQVRSSWTPMTTNLVVGSVMVLIVSSAMYVVSLLSAFIKVKEPKAPQYTVMPDGTYMLEGQARPVAQQPIPQFNGMMLPDNQQALFQQQAMAFGQQMRQQQDFSRHNDDMW